MSMATFPASLTARKSNPATSVTCRPARAASTAASVAGSTPRSGAGRIRPTRPGASAEAPAKPGSISRMPSSTAATSAPSGPTVSMEDASGYTPSSGTRPQVVFRPAIPQQAAGIRTEPPVSVPRATSASPAATATAEPLDDPPGSRPGSSGFTGVPDHAFTPLADQHSSVTLVLPTIRAPARRAAATTGPSATAGLACSATTWHPAVVGRPSTSMQSLTASRGPSPGTSRRTIQVGSMEAILPKPRSHGRFAWRSWRLRCRDLLMSHGVTMRVAIITESFPPDVNGVAHCVLRIAELLAGGGPHPLVIAPQPPRAFRDEKISYPFPVVRVPAVPLPGYPGFRLGLPGRRVRAALIRHRAELVHLASPVVLGAPGAAVARRLTLPAIAVYQTDLPSYARAYRLGRAGEAFAWRWLRGIHNGAARTLAPSTVTATGLLGQGIENVWLWGRGVDTQRFHPAKRSAQIRAEVAPGGELIAGYVGRLATEKRVDLLAGITALDGVRLVIVGAGPAEAALRQQLPGAVFLGQRRGEELAAIYASLDVFVHSGPYETFGQTLQEAAASGLPVVAPAAGGPLDLVEDEVTGYLVPPSDPGAFTAAVARLAAAPATRAAFGAAGRRNVLGRTWPALTEELTGHYAAVLRSTRGSRGGKGARKPAKVTT